MTKKGMLRRGADGMKKSLKEKDGGIFRNAQSTSAESEVKLSGGRPLERKTREGLNASWGNSRS